MLYEMLIPHGGNLVPAIRAIRGDIIAVGRGQQGVALLIDAPAKAIPDLRGAAPDGAHVYSVTESATEWNPSGYNERVESLWSGPIKTWPSRLEAAIEAQQ